MFTVLLAMSLAFGSFVLDNMEQAARCQVWVPEKEWKCTCCYTTKDGQRVCYRCPC